jgi:Sulfatase
MRAATGVRVQSLLSYLKLALAPTALIALDAGLRAPLLRNLNDSEWIAYVLTCIASVALWTDLLRWTTGTRHANLRRFGFCALVLGVWGTQFYAYSRYSAFMAPEVLLSGTQFFPSWLLALRFDALRAWPVAAGALTLGAVGPRYAAWVLRGPRTAAGPDLACLLAVAAATISPTRFGVQGAAPDWLAVSALGQLGKAHWLNQETVRRVHPVARAPAAVTAFTFVPAARRRNVVVILTESVRAASACSDPDAGCTYAPFSHVAAPDRLPLTQLRALDSTTAISLMVLLTGQPPNVTLELTRRPPSLFEYARAAGYQTAYVTSQNVLFGNMGTWLSNTAIDRRVVATQLAPSPSLETGADDADAATRMLTELSVLREPYVAVLHFSNTHYPYAIDAVDPPYLPENGNVDAAHPEPLRNRYHNAIYRQDRALAAFVRALRERSTFARTVVFYTADHGEQLGEHGYFGHTNTLYDEEIHVPGWVLGGSDALTDDERTQLRLRKSQVITHLDVLPTLLDLLLPLGFPGDTATPMSLPNAAGWPLQGASMLRALPQNAPVVPLANCTELWGCSYKSAGVIAGHLKLIAHEGTGAWQCFDVQADPKEQNSLPWPYCSELVAPANAVGKPF